MSLVNLERFIIQYLEICIIPASDPFYNDLNRLTSHHRSDILEIVSAYFH